MIETLHDIAEDLQGVDVAGFLVLVWTEDGIRILGSGTASGQIYELLGDAMRYYREATGAPGRVQ